MRVTCSPCPVFFIWLTTLAAVFLQAACAADKQNSPQQADGPIDPSAAIVQAPPSAVAQSDKDFILTSIPIHMDLSVQLYIAPCKAEKFPLQVRLVYRNELVATATLNHWQPWSRKAKRSVWGSFWDTDGDGDPVAFDIGAETNLGPMTVAIQPIKLNARKWAVLIRQCAGTEHSKRWFTLYEIHEDLGGLISHKVNKIWERSEGSGPYMAGVVVAYRNSGIVNRDSDDQSLIYLEGFGYSFVGLKDRFDKLRIFHLHWLDESGVIVEDPRIVLPALRVGKIFDTIEAAHGALAEYKNNFTTADGYPCLRNFWVLPSGRFKGHPKGKAVIVSVATSTAQLKRERTNIEACIPGAEISETIIIPDNNK